VLPTALSWLAQQSLIDYGNFALAVGHSMIAPVPSYLVQPSMGGSKDTVNLVAAQAKVAEC